MSNRLIAACLVLAALAGLATLGVLLAVSLATEPGQVERAASDVPAPITLRDKLAIEEAEATAPVIVHWQPYRVGELCTHKSQSDLKGEVTGAGKFRGIVERRAEWRVEEIDEDGLPVRLAVVVHEAVQRMTVAGLGRGRRELPSHGRGYFIQLLEDDALITSVDHDVSHEEEEDLAGISVAVMSPIVGWALDGMELHADADLSLGAEALANLMADAGSYSKIDLTYRGRGELEGGPAVAILDSSHDFKLIEAAGVVTGTTTGELWLDPASGRIVGGKDRGPTQIRMPQGTVESQATSWSTTKCS